MIQNQSPLMARPPSFTPAEDQIILTSRGCGETNRRLQEAGFASRTCAALKRRRHYLRSGPGLADSAPAAVDPASAELVAALRRRQALGRRQEMLAAELAQVRQEMRECSARVAELLDDLRAQLADEAGDGSGTGEASSRS